MKQEIIQQGAEAVIYKIDNKVIKDRTPKKYRLPELDDKIRNRRTKKETKLLEKANKIINTPAPLEPKEKTKIRMPFIKGKKLSEHLDNLSNSKEICKKIGEQIAKLHDNEIIHGDLTTSNMILVEEKQKVPSIKKQVKSSDSSVNKVVGVEGVAVKSKITNDSKVFFIDFGLGYESNKIEDKAVDLHLIKQALEARHYENYENFWKSIIKGYKISPNSRKVLERLKAVEKRGRYKKSY